MEPKGMCIFCDQPAYSKCFRCNLVYYCSPKHQKQDWPNHKDQCRACENRFTSETGHYLVAARDIKEGQLVITENPFVIGPAHFLRSPSCVGCCRLLPVRLTPEDPPNPQCPGCRWDICSNSCPGIPGNGSVIGNAGLPGGAGHALECALLSRLRGTHTSRQTCPWPVILPLRCMLLQLHSPKKWKWIMQNSIYADIKMSYMPLEKINEYIGIVKTLLEAVAMEHPNFLPDYSEEAVERVYAIIFAYGLQFVSSPPNREFVGLYQVAGFMQHSCVPNTRLMFDEPPNQVPSGKNQKTGRVTAVAVKDIRKGEMLTYAVTHHLLTTCKRQTEFEFMKNMRCSCPRCLDPRELGSNYSTMKCLKCGGWVFARDVMRIEVTNWKCEQCGDIVTSDEVSIRLGRLKRQYDAFATTKLTGRMEATSLEKVLEHVLKDVHPNHELSVAFKFLILRTYGDSPSNKNISTLPIEILERRSGLGHEVLKVLYQMGPALSRAEYLTGQCTVETVRSDLEILRRVYASGDWTKDRAIRKLLRFTAELRQAETLMNLPNIPFDERLQLLSMQLVQVTLTEIAEFTAKYDLDLNDVQF